MTIRFSCECGQELAVRDENAGKRVRCTACSSIVAAPNTTPPPPRAAIEESATAPIRFSCEDCGKSIQTKAEHAGKKTKCPGCGAVVVIPSAAGAATAAFRSDKPAPRRSRVAVEEDDEDRRDEDEDRQDEDREDERPGRRKKKAVRRGGGAKVWILVAVGGLLLAGAGLGAWLLFFRGGVSADFDLVPRDAAGFATVRVADLLKTDLGKKAFDLGRKQDEIGLLKMLEQTGLKPEDIERVTAVSLDFRDKILWIVVRTGKDYDQKQVLEGLKNPAKESHQGKDYYLIKGAELGITFVDSRTVVFGKTDSLKRCLALPKAAKSGPLDETILVASKSKYHAVMGYNGAAFVAMAMGNMMGRGEAPVGPAVAGIAAMPLQAGPFGPKPGAGPRPGQGGGDALGPNDIPKSMYLAVTLADQVEIEAGGEFLDKEKAAKVMKALENSIKALQVLIGLGMNGKTKADLGGVDPAQAQEQIKKIMDQLKPKQDGKMVTMRVSIDSKDLMKDLDQAVAGFAAPGGNGNGGDDVGVGRVREAANNATASNNFKQLSLAFIKSADDQDGLMPAQAILHPQTKQPLLSWRVAVLPNIEQGELYKQIHLNEPWDSPHNRTLWSKMPKVFELPGHAAPLGQTFVQVFSGPRTPFNPGQALRYSIGFGKRHSDKILIAEANTSVNWMKPEDKLSPFTPKVSLGSHYKKGSLVGMANGAVLFLPSTVSENTLKNAIDPGARQALGDDWPKN